MTSNSSSYPYDTIVYITDTIDGVEWQGSGVLIAPNEVLTASHVVYDSTYGPASNITVTPAYNSGSAPYGSAVAENIHYNDIVDANGELTIQQTQLDYAVIHLSTSFTNLGIMGLEANFAGGQANVSGYPGNLNGQLETTQETVTPETKYTVLDGTSIGPGSSGGPAWVTGANGIPYVVGLVSTAEGGVGSTGYFSEISTSAYNQIEAWIAQDTQGATGSTSSSSLISSPTIVASASSLTLSLTAAVAIAGEASLGWQAVAVADFSGSGLGAIAWKSSGGQVTEWAMDGSTIIGVGSINGQMGAGWQIAGTGDFNDDGQADLLWQNNGSLAVSLMNGTQVTAAAVVSGQMGAGWQVAAIGDLSGDGYSDVIWANTSGQIAVEEMNGTSQIANGISSGQMASGWQVAGTGDFWGDGRSEVLWSNSNGQLAEWTMNGTNMSSVAYVYGDNGPGWQVAAVADFNDNGMSDVVWESTSGQVDIWFMDGSTITQNLLLPGRAGSGWQIVGVKDLTGGGTPDIVWANGSGQLSAWVLGNTGDTVTGENGPNTYVFNQTSDAGMQITDFLPGRGGSVLDLTGLLGSIGYTGSNPLASNEVRMVADGANTDVQVDANPGAHNFVTVVTLDNVAPTAMTAANWKF